MASNRSVWCIVCIFASLVPWSTCLSPPEVTSPAGTFRGKVLTSFSGAEYASFRGIPYALPPTGDRRFAKPMRYPRIERVHDASEFGATCVEWYLEPEHGDEDCLYLNVFTPLLDESLAEGGRSVWKVFVYIHGGGLVLGNSNPYLPGDLVTRGKIVVVTMNYRLGWLGFLRGNSDSLPGNQGFYDQLMALQWVKDNIRAFGGDPNDVTLAGESAGSISAAILSISPLGKDLFNKAMFMSGSPFWFTSPPHTSNDLLTLAASQVGCLGESEMGATIMDIDKILSCLKTAPADKFKNILFSMPFYASLASSGDDLLPRPIPEAVNDSSYMLDVGFLSRSYIVSATKHEGYIRVSSVLGHAEMSSLDSAVRGLVKVLQLPKSVARKLLQEYVDRYKCLERSLIALYTDAIYVRRSEDVVRIYSKQHLETSGSYGSGYLLSFEHSPQYMPKSYMAHAVDMVYLFDLDPEKYLGSLYLSIHGDIKFLEEDLRLKELYIDLVAGFINTGEPNHSLSVQNISWPPYQDKDQHYLSFSLRPSVRQDILGDRRIIWEELLPTWTRNDQARHRKQDL